MSVEIAVLGDAGHVENAVDATVRRVRRDRHRRPARWPSGPQRRWSDDESDPQVDGDFDVLTAASSTLPFGTIFATGDADELASWVRDSGLESGAPVIDFNRFIAVAITIPDDPCADVLTEFTLEDGRLRPVFTPPPGGCRLPLVARTYIVAVDRSAIADPVTFRLEGDPTYDVEPVEVMLDGVGEAARQRPLWGRLTDVTAPWKDTWISAVTTRFDGSSAVVEVTVATTIEISAIVEVMTNSGTRGTSTIVLGADTTTSVMVPVSGQLDASQTITLRSADGVSDGDALDSVSHAGGG